MKTLSLILIPALFCFMPDLRSQEEEGPSCKDCHSDLSEREMMHYPTQDACDNCHNDPGPDHPERGFPGGSLVDSLPGLCFLCHDAAIHAQTVKHGAGSDKSCLSCHDPHGSASAYLLNKEKRELCLNCHAGIKKQDRHEFRHFPFEDDCGNCHASHSSTYPALLIDAYPGKLYAPGVADTFALCFQCHDQALLEEKTTAWGTGFRDGERNLHYLHLEGEKGRSCGMCHSLHASQNEHLMATSVPFGQWDMPLGFTPMENGGSCNTGCHSKMSYSREKPDGMKQAHISMIPDFLQ